MQARLLRIAEERGIIRWASGARKYKGAINTGKVYEQKIGLVNSQGDTLTLRRITVALHEPTRDGDTAIHLLSNVPRRHASAQTLAASYGKRWTIETMFQEQYLCQLRKAEGRLRGCCKIHYANRFSNRRIMLI